MTSTNIAYQVLLDALGALRNGFVYGCKIRAPHTFVLQMVWSKGSWQSLFQRIYDLTSQHATNLALNAVLFKLGVALLRLAQGTTQPWHHALVGGLAGFLIWGQNNAVNWQVNMYMMSRALSGIVLLLLERRKALADRGVAPLSSTEKALFYAGNEQQLKTSSTLFNSIVKTDNLAARLTAASIWGVALYVFFHHAHVLHGSLRASMDFIYKQGDEHEGSFERLIKGRPELDDADANNNKKKRD